MKRGLYGTSTDFMAFSEPKRNVLLGNEVVTRRRSADGGWFQSMLPNPDPILKRQGNDLRVYRDLRSDAHVGGCIRRRKAAVKAMERRVLAGQAGVRAARRAEDLLNRLDMDRVMSEMLDAVLYGWQPLELMWGQLGGAMVPLGVVGKPGEWFTFDQQGELRFLSRNSSLKGEALTPRKFLLARQEATYANPYGFADLSMCFWPTAFKRGGLKFWVTFTEKYGTPWLVGKQPRGTAPSEVESLLDKLEDMIQDAVAAIPDDASIEVLEADGKGASARLYSDLLMFCRSEVSIALLGQNQSTEADGTRASATAGLQVARVIRDGDARLVEATLNQLLRWVTDLNEGEGAPAPTVELYEETAVNIAQAKRDGALSRSGVPFSRSYWLRTYKLEEGDIHANSGPQLSATAPAALVQFAAVAERPKGDDIDAAVADEVAEWESLLRPMVDPLQGFLDWARQKDMTAGEVIAKLPIALSFMDDSALAAALTRASFAARAAAEANDALA